MYDVIKAVFIAAMVLAGLTAFLALIPFLLYGGAFVITAVVIYFCISGKQKKKPP